MKKFVLKSFPYIAIIIAYGLIGEYFLFKNKESISIERITEIQSQTSEELYYGREILGNSLSNYKFQMFKKTQPKVLVLGQSVTLQFRDFMFEPYQSDFYNTGLMARNVKDLNYVMDLIESGEIRKPELIFLGVDLSLVLTHTFLDETEWTRNYPEDRATSAQSHLKGIQRIFLTKKFRQIPTVDVGFGRAGMTGLGYRNDGTYRHKPEIEMFLKDSIYYDGDLIEYLKNRTSPFIPPFTYDASKAQKYFTLLERMTQNDIELILYVPPYSDVYFNEAIQDTMFNSFWQNFMVFQEELIARGYNVIPFTTPSRMGLTDHYMVDAEHPGEVMCAMQLMNAVYSKEIKGPLIETLTFTTVEKLMRKKEVIPISFFTDSIDIDLLENTQRRNSDDI
jgi:hypothetical protein